MFIPTNPNPNNKYTGDCVIRAICIAEDKEWDDVYLELMVKGYAMKDMIESNELWNSYLHGLGYSRYIIPDSCPDCYSVREFAQDHPQGRYILGTGTHAVAVINGNYYDTWDSGHKVPIYFWRKERQI
jgi:hypothetical protein